MTSTLLCLSCPSLRINTYVETGEVELSRPIPYGLRQGTVLVWFQPEADSEKRIQMQLFYLGMVPENTSRGVEK